MAVLIDGLAGQTESAVVGLIGAWGSGKTSVLHLVRRELSASEQWSVVDFNPWEFADVATLTREFMATVQSALPPKSKVRRNLARYATRLAPYTSLAGAVGVDPSKAFEAAARQLAGDDSLDAERAGLESLLRDHDQRILLLVDDVDRLQGDELTALLKLVRLVGRLPNVYYVLAYDETTLLDVLGTTDLANGRSGRALSYLDKIVQLRLDLPPAPQVLLDRMVEESLDHVTEANAVELSGAESERLGSAYRQHLRKVLVEPRHIKRFFGQVEAVYPLVGQEVDFVDFLLVTFLRTFFPEVYRLLRFHEAELTGTEFLIVDKPTPEQRIQAWRERLTSKEVGLPAESADAALSLLAELFPPLNRHGGGRTPAESKRIGSSEYFGRYLYLAIAPDDVTDADVRSALEEVALGAVGPAAESLLDKLDRAGEPIVDKLLRFSPTDAAAARATLPFAAQVLLGAPEVGFFGRARLVPSMWISVLLDHADLANPDELVDRLLEVVDLREINRAFCRTRKDRSERGAPPGAEFDAFGDLLAERTKEVLEHRATLDPSEDEGPLGLLLDWSEYVDDGTVRDWVRAQIDSGGPWTASEFVATFTSINISSGARWAGDVHLDILDRFLGTDWILNRMKPEQDPTINWGGHPAPTWDERKRRAHHVLANKAEEVAGGARP
jgi:type II secretory pathway predicted ATPase ExeA